MVNNLILSIQLSIYTWPASARQAVVPTVVASGPLNLFITLAAKRRRKGMVIILCLSVRKKLGKLQTLTAQTSYWQTSNYTRIKNNNRLLLKPFGYKVMTIYITHGFCFQPWEDSWAQLHTSKHNYYHIMTIASKALHQIKHNWGSPGYNIELAPSFLATL